MKSFRTRLTLILMIMIGLTMIVAGVAMAKVFKNSHIVVLEENMAREIKLLSNTLDFQSTENEEAISYYTKEAHEIGKVIDSRVTFINKNGEVIGDSEKDPLIMDNHLKREEIVAANQTGLGHVIRYSTSLEQNMLYVAAPVKVENVFDGYIRLSVSLRSIDEGLERGWTTMAVWLLILFAIAALVSYRMATSLTLPLEKIIKVARRITQLDYDARVQLERHDEVGQLGKAINAMADSLQNQLKRIRDNEDLIQSVLDNMTSGILMIDVKGNIAVINPAAEGMLKVKSEQVLGKSYLEMKQHYELSKVLKEGISLRVAVHEERSLYYPEEKMMRIDGVPMLDEGGSYKGILFLLQDISAIRRLENMRSEFVANVSHELKTPIAAVKGFAETLLGGGVTDEKTARSFLQIIYDESERLNRLISDILDLSKIESKRIPMDYSPVHLSSFFISVRETIATMAKKKRISLQMEVPDELFIEADEDKLKQIFINLLSNAINYTQEGGRVKVIVHHLEHDQGEDRIQFTVSDTGLGIPKKDLPRIFERFYRVDKARSRVSGGTGLGLSIVKHLVDMHNGQLSVDSELNIGSSFTVELPVLQDEE
ncbi:two-component system histidine kinase PnpS [Paenibacillus macquariensis]|uniref:histidine kinase n=1 Tax=Paenibacillus macquariensis TaxID=948756 RepID=A0ABY1JXP5_9BACL|nr:ATP-binding protein [Paenibacillus macquariensis]MEC0089277.1 ATP-binding protein [Paenibacillus macquariensis]OAB33315.1 PAS domain-containing sensor histidine kinase [Paenibacillus macquariensis subsp. macquariensis]SIQ94828.1 two-component system, OmpR family, phosphate regulon sensor histidine kinase PhoR [Paenibacillus macquariensis]